MVLPRAIPVLLLQGLGLVKTIKFKKPVYLGDPRNVVRIFNEREVDELVLLDIEATPKERPPQFELIQEIVSEAFMPVGYGGGIRSLDDAKRILHSGVEKIVINTRAMTHPEFIEEAAAQFGSQSIVVCIDVRKTFFGKYDVMVRGGRHSAKLDPVAAAVRAQEMGAGEIIVNSIDRDGTMSGYDLELIASVTRAVSIPVIACGGAATVQDFRRAVHEAGASAVAAGSMFVFQGPHRAVLINYPEHATLRAAML
jgi:cyclase